MSSILTAALLIFFHILKAKFQHLELLGKRQKMLQLQESMKENEATMSSRVLVAKDSVRSATDKITTNESQCMPTRTKKRGTGRNNVEELKVLLNDDASKEIVFDKLSTLIEKKTLEITQETNNRTRDCEAIQRRIDGYTNYIETPST